MANEKKLSSGFLLFIGVAFAGFGVFLRYLVTDAADHGDEAHSWWSSHAWMLVLAAGVVLVAAAIARMVRAKS